MTKCFSTPDLSDNYPNNIQIGKTLFNSYGAVSSFSREVETISCADDNSLVKEILNNNGEGKVLVIDAQGVEHASMVGDQIALRAYENNWSGILINGAVRDVEILSSISIGIFAKSSIPMKTDKNNLGSRSVDLFFGNVMIKRGNWLYADSNGWVISNKELEF